MTSNEKKDLELSSTTGKDAVALEHGPVKMAKEASANTLEALDDYHLTGQPPKYPWYIAFILGNEFCERFAYYGMKTILTIYFLNVLLWPEYESVLIYHLFSVLCYFTPIFGAMLADGFLGKFNTIFSLSVVYVGGLVLLTLAATPPLGLSLVAGTACGLVLIGFGTGGIKPVVPAYGGDQFGPGLEKQREQFFSIFYFCINAGSLISTFLTPILRSDVNCFGDEGCWPLAFGVPAALMIVAVIAFLLGRPFYRNVPSKDNIIAKVFGVSFNALRNKFSKDRRKIGATHWLDHADETKYEKSFVRDVKQVMPVLKLFLPLPMFWALFDQQGSRWTVQATTMDGRVTESFYLKPDQMQIVNPVLILALIPIFETIIFPIFDKLKIPFKALARMTVGMILAGVAFVIAGVLQMSIDGTVPGKFGPNRAELIVYNAVPCNVSVTGNFTDSQPRFSQEIVAFGEAKFTDVYVGEQGWMTVDFDAGFKCNSTAFNTAANFSFSRVNITAHSVHSLVIGARNGIPEYRHIVAEGDKKKPAEGAVDVRFIVPFGLNTGSRGGQIVLVNTEYTRFDKEYSFAIPVSRDAVYAGEGETIVMEGRATINQGKYQVWLSDRDAENGLRRHGKWNIELKNGGVLSVILKEDANQEQDAPWQIHEIVPPSSITIFLQLPQYFVMTTGEVLFSVSGLSFAYSQAPVSMKSVLQAAWLMTVAFGNVIVIIIKGAQFLDSAGEYFLFAGLIGAFAIIFAVMCRFYKYVDQDAAKKKDDEKAETDSTL